MKKYRFLYSDGFVYINFAKSLLEALTALPGRLNNSNVVRVEEI
jgi:hypothetical protein